MRIITYIFNNLRNNKGKYLACVLAISFAIGSFLSLSIFSNQLEDSVNNLFILGENSLIVAEKNILLDNFIPSDSIINENLTDDIIDMDGVYTVKPMIFSDIPSDSSGLLNLIGQSMIGVRTEDISLISSKMNLQDGRWFENPYEIVIGCEVLDDYEENPINSNITIDSYNLTIVGILEYGNIIFNRFIYCEYSNSQEILDMDDKCSVIYVIFNEDYPIDHLRNSIRALSTKIDLYTIDDIDKITGGILTYINLAQIVVGLIPLLISSLVKFSILTFNLRTRIKDFSILKVMGLSNATLSLLVLVEVMFISIFSYFVGVFIVGFFFYNISFNLIINEQVLFGLSNYMIYLNCLNPLSVFRYIMIALTINLSIGIIPIYSIFKKKMITMLNMDD